MYRNAGSSRAKKVLLLLEIAATVALFAAGLSLLQLRDGLLADLDWARQATISLEATTSALSARPAADAARHLYAVARDSGWPLPTAAALWLALHLYAIRVIVRARKRARLQQRLARYLSLPTRRGRHRPLSRRTTLERALLAGELLVAGFVLVAALSAWLTLGEVNHVYGRLQAVPPQPLAGGAARVQPELPLPPDFSAPSALGLPTPLPTPATPERPAGPSLPGPTPAPDQARRITIPAIGVNNYVFPSSNPGALRRGVAQYGLPVAPGQPGNLVLAAHHDGYGAIFRHLNKLRRGDSIQLYGDTAAYTYRVRDALVVDPDQIWVMLPTARATLTLITCHPYPLNTYRLVVFADLES